MTQEPDLFVDAVRTQVCSLAKRSARCMDLIAAS